MKLAIMQPYFFPYLGYFQLINAVDKFILYDLVNYIKKGYINRNKILNRSLSREWLITAPLQKQSSNSLIKEIKFADSNIWKSKLLKDIYFNYKRAPYFEPTYCLINEILNFETDFISSFNSNSIRKICKYINISTLISDNEIYFDEVEHLISFIDYDEKDISVLYPKKKVQRIFEICKREEANNYINSIGGKALYDKSVFKSNLINLFFLSPKKIKYDQMMDGFTPNLSIIDVMMFNSIKEINKLLNAYELV